MFADLPPSSSVTRLIVPAAPRIICCPTSVEPVKPIFATSGCSTSRCPTTEPLPGDHLDDALRDARLERRARRGAAPSAASAPPASARPCCPPRAPAPSFHDGDVQREVPRHDQPDDAERLAERSCRRRRPPGSSRRECSLERARVEVEHVRDHARPPRARRRSACRRCATRAAASSSWCSSTSVASRRSSRARSAGATARQAGNAAFARATAASVSSTLAGGRSASVSLGGRD